MGEKRPGIVSIIVPVYNAEQFIRQTIDCVQAQTYTDWELLLVDDCSCDKSREYIQEKSSTDKRVKLVSLEKMVARQRRGTEVSSKLVGSISVIWMQMISGCQISLQ